MRITYKGPRAHYEKRSVRWFRVSFFAVLLASLIVVAVFGADSWWVLASSGGLLVSLLGLLVPNVELLIVGDQVTRRWTWWLGIASPATQGRTVAVSELRSMFLECHVTSKSGDASDNTRWQLILQSDPDLKLWGYATKEPARADADKLAKALSLKVHSRY